MIRRFFSKPYALLFFALAALLMRLVFQAFPEWAHEIYRNGFFQGYRWFWDRLISSWLPFPAILLFVTFFTLWLIRRGKRFKRIQRKRAWLIPDGLSFIVIWFLLFWGYNYDCPSLTDLRVVGQREMEGEDFEDLAHRAHQEIIELRQQFPAGLRKEHLPEHCQGSIRKTQEVLMRSYGFGTSGEVRVREIRPLGMMHRLGISGIYLPFAGEGHAEKAEALIPRLFTVAHEMSHGYGISDEGEANFVAFVTLTSSSEPALNYAGWMQLLRYSLGKLRYWDYEAFEEFQASLSESLRKELDEIRELQNRYQPWFPEISEAMNDFYLKRQGVEAGVESYSGWLSLAYSHLDR